MLRAAGAVLGAREFAVVIAVRQRGLRRRLLGMGRADECQRRRYSGSRCKMSMFHLKTPVVRFPNFDESNAYARWL